MADWLDNLISQISASVQNGDSPADAVPSGDMSGGSSDFNPAKDSQNASSFLSALFTDAAPDTKSMGDSSDTSAADKPIPWEDNYQGSDVLTNPNPQPKTGFLEGVLKNMSLKKTSDGSIDWSDPKTVDTAMKMIMSGGSIINALMNKGLPQNYKSASQLQQEIKSPLSNWTPQQQATANAFFSKQLMGPNHPLMFASQMPNPITTGKGYASGGSVVAPNWFSGKASPMYYTSGGQAGGVTTGGTGSGAPSQSNLMGGTWDATNQQVIGPGGSTWNPNGGGWGYYGSQYGQPTGYDSNGNPIGGGVGGAAPGLTGAGGAVGQGGTASGGFYQGSDGTMINGTQNGGSVTDLGGGGSGASTGATAPSTATGGTGNTSQHWDGQNGTGTWSADMTSQPYTPDLMAQIQQQINSLPGVVNGVQMGQAPTWAAGSRGTTPGSSGFSMEDVYRMKADPTLANGTALAGFLSGGGQGGPETFNRGLAGQFVRDSNNGFAPAGTTVNDIIAARHAMWGAGPNMQQHDANAAATQARMAQDQAARGQDTNAPSSYNGGPSGTGPRPRVVNVPPQHQGGNKRGFAAGGLVAPTMNNVGMGGGAQTWLPPMGGGRPMGGGVQNWLPPMGGGRPMGGGAQNWLPPMNGGGVGGGMGGGAQTWFPPKGIATNPGGPVGAMSMAPNGQTMNMARGGALGHVNAMSGGQDDVVPTNLAGGEYVMDADTVSSLGDGNNAAGAKKLDTMRANIRAHKRSAPTNQIPPKAKSPEAYMKGAK